MKHPLHTATRRIATLWCVVWGLLLLPAMALHAETNAAPDLGEAPTLDAVQVWSQYTNDVSFHAAQGTFEARPEADLKTFYLFWSGRMEEALAALPERDPMRPILLRELMTLQSATDQYTDAIETNRALIAELDRRRQPDSEAVANLARIALAGYFARKPAIPRDQLQLIFLETYRDLTKRQYGLQAATLKREFARFFLMDDDMVLLQERR